MNTRTGLGINAMHRSDPETLHLAEVDLSPWFSRWQGAIKLLAAISDHPIITPDYRYDVMILAYTVSVDDTSEF